MLALCLAGCNNAADEIAKQAEAERGASVYRICRDGSYIWHYTDGSFHTTYGSRVDDPDTVCAQ